MDDWAQRELAYDLADAVAPHVDAAERTTIFTAVGAGDWFPAMETVVGIALRRGIRVHEELRERLARWLDGYRGRDDEPRLRQLIEQLGETPLP